MKANITPTQILSSNFALSKDSFVFSEHIEPSNAELVHPELDASNHIAPINPTSKTPIAIFRNTLTSNLNSNR